MKKPPKDPVIGIIGGKGKMGGYFADVFKQAGYKVLLSDVGTKLTNRELAKKADVVIISVPISETRTVINKIVQYVRKDAVLIDLTSLKDFPVRAMLAGKSEVIGLHPMFGPTNPLPGQTVIACPVRSARWYPWLQSFLKEKGAEVVEMEPKEHDRIMGIVQGMVHFADIAFGHALKELKVPVKKYLRFAGPASELKIAFVGRLLAQDPELYASIELENPHALKAIKEYAKSINKLMSIDELKDAEAFASYFRSAGKALKKYEKSAFDDTNYLIHALLQRRKKTQRRKKASNPAANRADIAVLGPQNTFSDIAGRSYAKKGQVVAYCASIPELFDGVEKGRFRQGIAPLENMLSGTVRETFDELYARNIYIQEKMTLQIRHALVALPETRKTDIYTITSHPQALSQCSKYLKKHYPAAEQIEKGSTIQAFEAMVGENDGHTGVIIPESVANQLPCRVLGRNIGDREDNRTVFIVFSKEKTVPTKVSGPFETSVAFTFKKDTPGSLHTLFQEFAQAGINLTRIESRPSKKEMGKYVFFLEFEGSPYQTQTKKVLASIRKKVATLKILGVYPLKSRAISS